MDQLIVYGSQYGTTQRYAERFSQLTRLPCISSEAVKDLSCYGRVIHFGGLYAGGVKGLRRTLRALGEHTGLIIVTVGLADVTDEENLANIRNALRRQVHGHLLEKTQVFHLRGGIDYRKLSLKHKAMMTLLYHSVKKPAGRAENRGDTGHDRDLQHGGGLCGLPRAGTHCEGGSVNRCWGRNDCGLAKTGTQLSDEGRAHLVPFWQASHPHPPLHLGADLPLLFVKGMSLNIQRSGYLSMA